MAFSRAAQTSTKTGNPRPHKRNVTLAEERMPTPKQYASPAQRQQAYRQRQQQARLLERQEKGLPALPAIASLPGQRRWQALLAQAHAALVCVHSEMQTYYDQRSDAWQESLRGEALLERIESIETLMADLDAVR